MKSTLAFATAAVTQAANLEQASGYVIDLCPSSEPVTPMTMPSNASILDLNRQVGYVEPETKFEANYPLLNKLAAWKREQELIKEGVSAYELEQMVGDWEARQGGDECYFEQPATTHLDWKNIAAIRKIGNIKQLASAYRQ